MIAELWGFPISKSLSPALHNNWFQTYSLPHQYNLFPCNDEKTLLNHFQKSISSADFLGANITIPHKRLLCSFEGLTKSTQVTKWNVANTLYRDNEQRWALENTDIEGILACVNNICKQNQTQLLKSAFCILGTGATAISCVAALLQAGVLKQNIMLCGRSLSNIELNNFTFLKIQEFLNLQKIFQNDEIIGRDKKEKLKSSFDSYGENNFLILNTLPNGSLFEGKDLALLILQKTLSSLQKNSKHLGFFDASYFSTPAQQYAQAESIAMCNGKLMLETQAARSFELWTNIYPVF